MTDLFHPHKRGGILLFAPSLLGGKIVGCSKDLIGEAVVLSAENLLYRRK